MGNLDKEIRVIAVKGERGNDGQDGQDGQDGKSSYELAVEEELFSGTLQEWIETFATPENYITRTEFQKVTQAQYDAMAEAGTLVANCYYLIIDDTTAQDFATMQNKVSALETTVSGLSTVATSGNYNDLINKPTLYKRYTGKIENFDPTSQAQADLIFSFQDYSQTGVPSVSYWISTGTLGTGIYMNQVMLNVNLTASSGTNIVNAFYIDNNGQLQRVPTGTTLYYSIVKEY